jgi:hypothetical protein
MMTWPSSKVARVAYLLGQGYNSPAIARRLDDDTQPELIRKMARHWGLSQQEGRGNATTLTIHLGARVREKLERQAAELDISPSEFVRRIAVCAINDHMYRAVTDGAFE